ASRSSRSPTASPSSTRAEAASCVPTADYVRSPAFRNAKASAPIAISATMTSAMKAKASKPVRSRATFGLPLRGRWTATAVGLAVLAAGTLLHLERQRGVPVWNSLWAEDGQVFLSGAVRSFRGTFFDQNGGYVHVVPRLIAGIVAALPVHEAAAGMAVGAAAAVALVAGFV